MNSDDFVLDPRNGFLKSGEKDVDSTLSTLRRCQSF